MDYVNPVMLLMLISQICLGICAWHSPRFLRRAAAHLLTRADVVDVSRKEGERRMKLWLDELGLDADPRSSKAPHQLPVHRFSQDEVKAS
jgi:hypothetical protein